MKSEHRHELETNVLAKKLDVWVERLRPYASTIAGVVVAIVIVMFLWSYFAGSSSARQNQAWDTYNQAITEAVPDIDQLRQAAQEYPGTKMQHLADVTWADGQVFIAARDYIYNRNSSKDAIEKAVSAYRSVIQSSDDARLVNRAQLGIARAHEIDGKLAEARDDYRAVKGAFEEYAKRQADRLEKPDSKETYAWLASARPKLPRAPQGAGTPGVQPEFSAGDLALPNAPAGTTSPEGSPTQGQSIEDLLKGLEVDFGAPPTGDDRYAPGATPPATDTSQPPTTTDDKQAAPTTPAAPTSSAPAETTSSADGTANEGTAPTDSAATTTEPVKSDDAPK
jgi:hypothetical protein